MKIFEKIRNFWKRERDDIKKNCIISAGVNDFDTETIKQACDIERSRTVYVIWANDIKSPDPVYMIGFENREDAEKYLNNMKNHLYEMGYRHVGMKRCNIVK